MAKPFHMLRDEMSQEAKDRAKAKAQLMMKEMPLAELRQARKLSQEQIASSLHVKQAAISKLERRTDMYISTLRKFVKAMGGDLEITARFPDGSVKITHFEEIDRDIESQRFKGQGTL
ncbi:MAG: XRE family transcriptional regulator [Syntrophobacteraceae bacterium]|jgi:transcriptional regulator with XRE-family HTH domain